MSGAGLVYVVGPSGAGKDSLIAFARERVAAPVSFARRYITRPRDTAEDHVPLTPGEFAARKAQGLFALDWASHGFRYGIGVEIDDWLARGAIAVVNGSRDHLPVALARYPRMRIVHIRAAPAVLAARLARRGRETPAQIAARLGRMPEFDPPPNACVCVIDNSGDLTHAGRAFVDLLESL